MTRKEIDELNLLAQRLLIMCAEAKLANQEYEARAERERKRFAVVKTEKEGYKNERKTRKTKNKSTI